MEMRPLWVFGYASLIWNPDFPIAERHIARLTGYSRSFCMWSIHHRGTEEDPGLVLALDQSDKGACEGVAFRVADGAEDETLAMLRERELISSAYREMILDLELRDGRAVPAVAYVINREHRQYCSLSFDAQARIIANAVGGRGPNTEYLYNTAEHLTELGIEDPELTRLAEKVRSLTK